MVGKIKFPHIEVQLSGEDGNAFLIVSRVRRALRQAGVSEIDVEAFFNEALSGDFHHVIRTVSKTVTVL